MRPRLPVARHPRQHLAPQQPQERLGRVGPARFRLSLPQPRLPQPRLLQPRLARRIVRQPHRPARRRQRPRRLQCRIQRRLQPRPLCHQLVQPPPQPPCARPPALRAQQPAPQLRRLQPRQLGRERPVRRVEHVMPLVEHIPRRHRGIVQSAPGRLRHHQRMVCHHQMRRARPADRVFDEAALPVRAGGVDALAAPIRQAQHRRRPEQLRHPARQIPALDVPVGRRQRPACDQPKRHQRGRDQSTPPWPTHHRPQRLLIVQQTQVVFTSLAHDHAPPPLRRVGEQPRQFRIDLALQMPRERADPDRAAVLLRPQAGRRDIPQRLARPGARLGQNQVRVAPHLPRCERRRRRAGIIRLTRPLLRLRPQHRGQPPPRLRLGHRQRRGRGQRRRLFPLGQPLPHQQRLHRGRRIGPPQRRHHERRPAPPRLPHARRQRRRIAIQSQLTPRRQPPQQHLNQLRQQRDLGLQPARRHIQIERQGQPTRRRRRRPSRQHERKQLQDIEAWQRPQPQPPQRRRRVHQHRRIHHAHCRRGVVGGQP